MCQRNRFTHNSENADGVFELYYVNNRINRI